jgi:hypothetical protein
LVGELQNRGGGDERAMMMVVELRWRLGFSVEVKLALGCVGRCTRAYIGMCKESGRIKIRIRDKI